jgi:hypothetical protein
MAHRMILRLGQLALSSLAFLGGLALACSGIHAFLPERPIVGIHPKLVHLSEGPSRYDTLFVGTSRTYHQVIPADFDAGTAGASLSTTSFNGAVDGLFPPEDAYYLERIGRTGARFRWVFLEVNPIRLRIDDAKRGTERIIYWHDARRLRLLLREAVEIIRQQSNRASWAQQWVVIKMAAERIEMFLRAQSNLGRGELLRPWLLRTKSVGVDRTVLGARGDGYLEIDYAPLPGAARQAYEAKFAAKIRQPGSTGIGTKASQDALADSIALIRKLGAEPVLVIPPTVEPRMLRLRDPDLKILDFSDPQRFPELFRAEHRMDAEHLNTAGARVYTKLLAQEFTLSLRPGR